MNLSDQCAKQLLTLRLAIHTCNRNLNIRNQSSEELPFVLVLLTKPVGLSDSSLRERHCGLIYRIKIRL